MTASFRFSKFCHNWRFLFELLSTQNVNLAPFARNVERSKSVKITDWISRYQNLLSGQKLDDFQNHQKSKKRHRFAKELWRQVILSLKKSRRGGGFSTQRCILLQYYQPSRQKVEKGVGAKENRPFFLFVPPFVLILLKNEKKGQQRWSSGKSLDLWHLHHRSTLLYKDLSWPPSLFSAAKPLKIDVNAFYH